jgi:hypothetical protein
MEIFTVGGLGKMVNLDMEPIKIACHLRKSIILKAKKYVQVIHIQQLLTNWVICIHLDLTLISD